MSKSKEVLKCLSDLKVNALKKKQYNNKIKDTLQDPLLWLRLSPKYSNEDVFGSGYPSIRSPETSSADWFGKRVLLCEETLKGTARDEKSHAQHLQEFLSDTKDINNRERLQGMLFPRLPESVLHELNIHSDAVPGVLVPREAACADVQKHEKGIVTDLYVCPGKDGWEGYVLSSSGSAALYRFTSASCSCAFPVCLGSIVHFCVGTSSENSSSCVIHGTLRVVQYFPGSLSAEYAAQYLQQLDRTLEASDRLSRITQLPGPFATILNEQRLYSTHQSQILALLNSISADESGHLSEVLWTLGICSSDFIQSLPQILCSAQKHDQTTADVPHFVRLVALLVGLYPADAYTMATVIHDTTKLASTFEKEFTTEASNLGQAVIRACSIVHHEEEAIPEVCNTPVDPLLDPLLWVTFFTDKSTTQSLRKLIPQKPLCDDEGVVAVRKSLENIIVQSLEETKLNPSLPVVKKMSLQLAHSTPLNLPTKKGIVTDLYSDGSGYVALVLSQQYPSRQHLNQRVFKINVNVTCILGTPQAIHIGDVVTFQVSEASLDTARQIVRVNQYCPNSLDVSFGREYFSLHKELEALLQNEAAMKGILNAPHVYSSTEVCTALFASVTNALSDSTASIKKRMLDLLKCSSFIRDLVKIAPENVSNSVPVLECYLEQYPNEVCALAPTLHDLVARLLEQGKPQEVASFICFLSTSSCLLPPSIEIERQPWQSVPTILTRKECKAGAVDNKEFLPHVKDRGCYSSVHEYGRTYFLLLRADCHGCLAKTIFRLREPESSVAMTGSEFEIPVCDASFVGLSNKSSGRKLVYHFNIETRPLSAENLSPDSPLFMCGNLLCFSVGGRFEDDIIWATINHIPSYVHTVKTADGRLVKSSEVFVQFCTESNQFPDEEAMLRLKKSENAVVLESPAFFRAYQPVLEALKKMDLQQIHFIPDLLEPGPQPQATLELIDDNTVVTDLAGLYNSEAGTVPAEMTVGELRVKLEGRGEDLCLHKYQRKAVNQALSQALSLIQGPPGTGKSYMGMQLLRLFLSMKDSAGKLILDNKPALVMAYKNRALDHFILMCESFCPLKYVVRIGHASKDNEEKLKPTLLRERVMTTLRMRYDTVALQRKLDSQYERVRKARLELEAITKLEALEDCVDLLTPELLKSLVLDDKECYAQAGDVVVEEMKTHPDVCLKLLQMKQMGKVDRYRKKAIDRAVKEAWDKWVAGATNCQKPTHEAWQQKASFRDDNDSEYDLMIDYHETYEDEEENKNEVESFSHTFYDDLEEGAPVEVSNVWELNADKRRQLITSLLGYRYDIAMEELKESMKQYNMTLEIYEKWYEKEELRVLKSAKIVAMTTTGAAINQRLLNQLEAPVVFVEEAAEILESNLLAILTPHVKHMVLIGDHKQLKPNLAWSRLERHKFNLSLFERLIRNKYPRTLLLRQHRMHPTLVPLYGYHYCYGGDERIRSNEKVKSLEKPECMGKNFFWWSYEEKYENRRESSQYNPHEVEMVVSLCSWLVCNGVEATSIAVLTPYRGQLEEVQKSLKARAHTIRKMPPALACIDVYTVDEYQGHESDVVILSLVRSNTMGKIGFLSRYNRLVVSTSRQKSALYIVGNHAFLEKSSPNLWKTFIEICRERDSKSIGCKLPIIVGNFQEDCQSPSELDERVKCVLEVTANNESVASANETDSDLDLSTTSGSIGSTPSSVRSTGTPPSVRSLSVTSTPASVRSGTATSTPGSVRSLSVTSPWSVRSVSAVSTPVSPPTSVPPPTECLQFSPVSSQMPSSASNQSPHNVHTVRQQSSPAQLTSRQHTTREHISGDDEACVSSSTSDWVSMYALKLKDTGATTRWKFIGRRLGLNESDIEVIEKKNQNDIQESLYKMMLKWRDTNGEKATKDELLRALREEKLTKVVEDLLRLEA